MTILQAHEPEPDPVPAFVPEIVPHTCPFSTEIKGDYSLCTCDEAETQNCLEMI